MRAWILGGLLFLIVPGLVAASHEEVGTAGPGQGAQLSPDVRLDLAPALAVEVQDDARGGAMAEGRQTQGEDVGRAAGPQVE